MRLVLARAAEADLERIGDHIAKDNPARALSFVGELQARLLGLLASPHAFPLVPRYEHLGIRRCVHGNYLIFYRVAGQEVQVLHVLHGAMDVEAHLFPR
ncbi:type II toxin-antitoxin system RelE/ParE family toxin [Aquabacter spiritensis]|uniref:Plasmid stabilization system protein ParE n=1 Tax=Aquabacter spiritensis TaxID=933073 RepID=A0A4R3M557_9HYPH|nr:type II toxin-antitoxin system RelE/ParE family toxin [Aquabacter spiritensis]TCT07713.1 plasmid stabilization system protein ParE [Aquabacter spiritensis]